MNTELLKPGSAEITATEAQELAQCWYHNLDVHAPLAEFIPFLAGAGLTMVFPEATVTGFSGFKGWYERVIGLFFDEVHTLKQVQLTPKGDRAEVKVVVKWEASRWTPPAPRSERIMADAYQTWELIRSSSGQPVILTYVVDAIEYYAGSAKL